MSARDHYSRLLAGVYSWMSGDFRENVARFRNRLAESGVPEGRQNLAIDLGAGHGIQSFAMASRGYRVLAVDFDEQLLNELKTNCDNLPVVPVLDRLENFGVHAEQSPHLMVCWGDTLTHLQDNTSVNDILKQCAACLAPGGWLLLSFRNYTSEKPGTRKIIPVKADEGRHMTCILDFGESTVNVTDLVHERSENGWQLRHSSYKKLKLDPDEINALLEKQGMKILRHSDENGVHAIVARR